MKIEIKQFLYLLWLTLTFRGFRLITFYYYTECCGMVEKYAYKRALEITRKQYIEQDITEKVKSYKAKTT